MGQNKESETSDCLKTLQTGYYSFIFLKAVTEKQTGISLDHTCTSLAGLILSAQSHHVCALQRFGCKNRGLANKRGFFCFFNKLLNIKNDRTS